MHCTLCKGPFHPATGHWVSEKRHWCGACMRNEFITLLKSYLPRRWGGVRFYDHAVVPTGDTSARDLALDNVMNLKIKRLRSSAQLPAYATAGAAGMDVKADLGNDFLYVKPGEAVVVPTGLSMEIPEGYEVQVRPRSGLAAKNGVTVLNSPGTIDSDYRGEVKVILINHGPVEFSINHGDRIAQLVLSKVERLPIVEVQETNETDRGAGGLGSTGIK